MFQDLLAQADWLILTLGGYVDPGGGDKQEGLDCSNLRDGGPGGQFEVEEREIADNLTSHASATDVKELSSTDSAGLDFFAKARGDIATDRGRCEKLAGDDEGSVETDPQSELPPSISPLGKPRPAKLPSLNKRDVGASLRGRSDQPRNSQGDPNISPAETVSRCHSFRDDERENAPNNVFGDTHEPDTGSMIPVQDEIGQVVPEQHEMDENHVSPSTAKIHPQRESFSGAGGELPSVTDPIECRPANDTGSIAPEQDKLKQAKAKPENDDRDISLPLKKQTVKDLASKIEQKIESKPWVLDLPQVIQTGHLESPESKLGNPAISNETGQGEGGNWGPGEDCSMQEENLIERHNEEGSGMRGLEQDVLGDVFPVNGGKTYQEETGRQEPEETETGSLDMMDLDDFPPEVESVEVEQIQGEEAQQPYMFCVMRHSSRLDEAIQTQRGNNPVLTPRRGEDGKRQRDETNPEVSDKCRQKGEDNHLTIPWPDRDTRPYDTPIVDLDLPAQQAKELGQRGFGRGTRIFSSPFRRCLQTAGVVARQLGIEGVTVHLGVGERMDKVRKELAEAEAKGELDSEDGSGVRQECHTDGICFSYLDHAGMLQALGEGVKLEGITGRQPPLGERGIEAKQRFIAILTDLCDEQLGHGSVLVIAHGDTLDAAGESMARQIIYQADYCAWAMFDLQGTAGRVAESFGVQMIPLC